MDDLNRMVIEHDSSIRRISDAITSIAENSKETNVKLEVLAMSMSKQELILEKIANIDDKFENRNKAIHKRIDSNESDIRDLEKSNGILSTLNLEVINLKGEIAQLKDDKRWIVRLLIGKFLLLLVGALFIVKG